MKIKFIPANKHPQESGLYFWKSIFDGDIRLIRVAKVDSCLGDGYYFAIVEFRGKDVRQFNADQFSEKIEFI